DRGGAWTLAGIHSRGQEGCETVALDERLDRHLPRLAEFIARYPGACVADDVCNEDCTEADELTTDPDCQPPPEEDEPGADGDGATTTEAPDAMTGGCAAGGLADGGWTLVLLLAGLVAAGRRRHA